MKLILASSSPRRKDLLTQIGFAPDVIESPDIPEIPHKREKPSDFAKRMGIEKAEIIAAKYNDAIIIAADTLVAVGTRIIGKAENRAEAFREGCQVRRRCARAPEPRRIRAAVVPDAGS